MTFNTYAKELKITNIKTVAMATETNQPIRSGRLIQPCWMQLKQITNQKQRKI
ncbi:MAG: hypothetical protein ACRC2R_21725 [Xenococcaceae cyanobacterium]